MSFLPIFGVFANWCDQKKEKMRKFARFPNKRVHVQHCAMCISINRTLLSITKTKMGTHCYIECANIQTDNGPNSMMVIDETTILLLLFALLLVLVYLRKQHRERRRRRAMNNGALVQ